MEINIDDFSLEELQKQFLQVQEESSTFRLSELNVIELVNYLVKTNRLKNLLFTLDGKEYVTEEQARREILDQIVLSSGRINRTSLPELLNLDFAHIDNICNRLVKEDKSLMIIQGEIITEEYLDSACEEINELLQESGHIYLGDLTKRLVLPSDFIQQVVSTRLGKKIQGRLDNDTIFTQAYIKRHKARVRGALSALTRPTPLTSVNDGLQESLFDKIVQELMKEKRVNGSIHRGVFIPKVYEDAVDKAIASFFNQNGFITYDRVESMISAIKSGSNATKNYLKEKFPDSIFVTSGVVGQTLSETLDGSIDEALTNNTPLDITTVVPTQLEKEDIRKLLDRCPSIEKHRQHLKKEPYVLFNGTYVLTSKNIEDILQSFEERAKNDVKKVLTSQPKKEASKPVAKEEADDSDEEDTKKSRRSKGKKRGGAGKKSKKDQDVPEEDSSAKQQDKSLLSLVPKQKEIMENVQKILKDDAPSQYDDDAEDVIEALVKYLTPLLQQMYLTTKENIYVDTASDRRKQHQEFEKKLQDLYSEVVLNYKAVNSLILDERADKKKVDENSLQYKLEKYLVKTKCTYIMFLIAENQALHHQLPIDTAIVEQLLTESELDEDKVSSEMNKVVKEIIKKHPKEEDQKIITALQMSLQSGMEDFLTKLDSTAEHFNLFLKQMDKKKEKLFLVNKREELKTMIIPQLLDPGKLLLALVIYVFLSRENLLIHAPGKLVQPLVVYLQKHLAKKDDDQEILSSLAEAQQLVTKYLIAQRKTSKSEQFLFDEQDQLDQALDRVKFLLLGIEPSTPTPTTSSNKIFTDDEMPEQVTITDEDEKSSSSKKKKKTRKT